MLFCVPGSRGRDKDGARLIHHEARAMFTSRRVSRADHNPARMPPSRLNRETNVQPERLTLVEHRGRTKWHSNKTGWLMTEPRDRLAQEHAEIAARVARFHATQKKFSANASNIAQRRWRMRSTEQATALALKPPAMDAKKKLN